MTNKKNAKIIVPSLKDVFWDSLKINWHILLFAFILIMGIRTFDYYNSYKTWIYPGLQWELFKAFIEVLTLITSMFFVNIRTARDIIEKSAEIKVEGIASIEAFGQAKVFNGKEKDI